MTDISRRQILAAAAALPVAAAVSRPLRAAESRVFTAPVALELNRLWLGVSVEGLPVEPFILDTGAIESMLSDEWAEQVKLRMRGSSGISGVGGVERTAVVRTKNVVIGGAFHIPYMEFHGSRRLDEARFRGLIGAGLFTSQNSDLDFVAKQWRIYPDGRTIRTGLYAIPDSYLARGMASYLTMPVQIGDFAGRFALDTGAPTNMLVDGRAARKLGWWDSDRPYVPQASRGFGRGSLPTRTYRTDKARLHKFAFPRPLITLAKPGESSGDFSDIDGLIGLHMIRHFHISTDPKAKQMWAAPNGLSFAGTEQYPMSGLWFERKGEVISAADVGTGSPAAAAGMQVGDRVTGLAWDKLLASVNGKAGDRVALDTERDGKARRVEFVLKPYL